MSNFLAKRSNPNLENRFVMCYPKVAIKFSLKKIFGRYYSYYMQNIDFQNELIRKISKPPKICISYDGFSEILFREWKGKSFLILDLTIALPQYFVKTQLGDSFSVEKLSEMDEFHQRIFNNALIEIEFADLILCGSQFVQDSVRYFKPDCEKKCVVLPYGVEPNLFGFPDRNFKAKESLNFVFVGTVDKRKGADILLNSWNDFSINFPNSKLHFYGDVHLDKSICQSNANVFFHGRVSQKELSFKLKEMDVFILPTLHEGSSISIYQAMASQLPIITTINSGTILKHNESCLIIDHTKKDILEAMTRLSFDIRLRKSIGRNAYLTSLNYSWEKYGQDLIKIINKCG